MFTLLILVSGCKGKKDVKKSLEEIRTGSEGITMSFLPNAPPDKIYAEQTDKNEFDVVLELRNKGAYPQPGQGNVGRVYLSGYDSKIINFETQGSDDKLSADIYSKALEGKSTINPNGGLDLVTFKGKVSYSNLNVEKYEPILLATACYVYETIAGPPVCIDPNPYTTVKEKKVCEVQDISLSNQGAPIAVTAINEEAFATKTQFKITIKNVGGGDVLKRDNLKDKCDPFGEQKNKVTREDIDKVWIDEVKVGSRQIKCSPFVDKREKDITGYIRLINGEGFIICEFPKEEYKDSKTAFITPLTIKLIYAYRNTAEKKIQIKKEGSSEVSSQQPQPGLP
ncbi:hypothetical protein HYX00_01805 [Candidatus Woesearchaeota archaeon]|nr:hypothetical protein [Candidatus Woesearchaeota archaeon]